VSVLAIVLVIAVVVPLVVYFSVKLGTYAHLRARDLFEQRKTKETPDNG
jgi:hypothetical protein